MSDTLPAAFAQTMQQQLGSNWKQFAEAIQKPSPISIRFNPSKIESVPNLKPIPWTSLGFYLSERPLFTLDPLFHAGTYYVQEASSMFIEHALKKNVDFQKRLNVLDLCAAPGGKSTLLASLINENSLLISNEVIRSRASILAENLQKWGNDNIVVTNNDPEDFQTLNGFFDVIVVDAPCSGEGLFRKDPDAMKEWSEENVDLCSKRQRRIVADIWPALKQDGILIYSTCTYNRLENEENLQWIKNEHDVEFLAVDTDSSWGVQEIIEDKVKGYRFYPHKVAGEGFFMSIIRKKESEDTTKIKASKNTFGTPTKKVMDSLVKWIRHAEEKQFIQRDELIQFFPKAFTDEIAFFSKNFKLVIAGTFTANVKQEKLIPEHALAMSNALNGDHFGKIDMPLDQALKYLRKETLPSDGSNLGFNLITYQHTPLGWANVLSNRINNLYPAEWRIRMK
ncbi:methyltransferase RsmF C-terminal domain-like protein [Pseudochryseolinea flava]|uniref:rRNA methyltransferase n=1 Tax=Pseudochryseolinea flava TaxID=2059302 RepID=A0A364XX24_9BACT|nr:rRNA methyltransferase [Pseudochryseolinea flava]RAV98794.1 rRNA methyltransferase [Pseudochryseolinea flava]